MHVSARSYLTVGVAALSATAIAIAPVQPLGQGLGLSPQRVSANLSVNLAAAVDPITAWVDTLQLTGENVAALFEAWSTGTYVQGTGDSPVDKGYSTGVPLPIIQQVLTNLGTYLGELPDIGAIAEQIFGNIGNAIRAPFEPGAEVAVENVGSFNQNVSAAPLPGLGELTQRTVWALLPGLLPEETYNGLKPILDFLTTPVSGLLLGALGPLVAPVLAVVNSVSAAFAYLTADTPDFQSAIFELINIPANAVNAFLNGGPVLDLSPVLGLLGVDLPPSVKSLGLQMGGLFSPGGVGFDGLATSVELTPEIGLDLPGLPVGPIGSLVGLTNYVAKSIVVTPPPIQAEPPAEAASSAAPVVESTPASEAGVEATSSQAPVSDEAAPQAISAVAEADDRAPAPKRAGRGAAARGGDSAAGSAGAGDSDAKPAARASAARRAG